MLTTKAIAHNNSPDDANHDAFKQTELGLIPADWEIKSIGRIAPLQRGFDLPNSKLKIGKNPVVYSNGVMNHHEIAMVKGPGVVTGRSGTIGKIHYIEEDFWPHNTSLWVTKFNDCTPKFIYYLYSYIDFSRFSSGSGVPTLNRNDAHSFILALPPSKAEQEAIAEVLSDADALIESLEQLIAKKRQIKQGAMYNLLSSEIAPAISNQVYLGDITKIKTGSRNNEDKVEDGKYQFFVRSQNVERINDYSYDCEAILVPGEGNIGSIFHYVSGKFDVHQRVYAIRDFAEGVCARFIYYYMAQNFGAYAMKNTVKATVDSLRLPTFLGFEIANLPSYEEQLNVVAILSAIDAELESLELKLEKAKQLKQGMMQDLLTGKVRLI